MRSSISPAVPLSEDLSENKIQQIIDRLRDLYRKNLTKTAIPRETLADYGLTDQSIIERYQTGYSDGSLPRLLPLDPALRSQLVRLGVLDDQGRERFVGCLIFPIDSADGRRINLWVCPKEGPARFLLSRPVPLWNGIAAKHSTHLYVFASPIEALSAAAAGLSNIAALDPDCGQPAHTEISGWGVQRLSVIVPDTSEGVAQGEQIQRRLEPLKSSLAKVADCKTINELFRSKGPQGLADAVAVAVNGLEVSAIPGLEPRADGFDYTIGGRRYRVRGLLSGPQKLTAVVSRERGDDNHVDKVDLLASRSRKEFAREIVRKFREPADLVEADVGKILAACERWAAQPKTAPKPAPGTIPEADRKLAEGFGRDPRLIEIILSDYEQFNLVGERAVKLLSYLTMSSRKLSKPLALLTVSSSGTGKSALQKATVSFCPPEEVENITNLSGKALFHKDKDSLKFKLIAIEEAEGAKQADYALRVLISSGELTTEVAVKDHVTGKLTTVRNRVEGPVAVMLTTTSLS